jgi:NADH dehydrogenase [ubiquinone] 1 alpha subcomplex assembly factor 7
MEWALLHPKHGYYNKKSVFGIGGDFITAPDISQLFGEMLGIWVAERWQAMGGPENWQLIELGPGRGTMMADMLRSLYSLARALPNLIDGLSVRLVEASPARQKEQEQTLTAYRSRLSWPDELPPMDQPTIILANEFLDALPIEQYQLTEKGWHQRMVGLDETGQAAFMLHEETLPSLPWGEDDAGALPGLIAEHCPDAHALLEHLATASQTVPLAALFIDYGYANGELGDTLQAVQGHAYADILSTAGEADLTAHVDFQRLLATAKRAGADVYGAVAQGAFLTRMGMLERAAMLAAKTDEHGRTAITTAVDRLISTDSSPNAMGELFKAMALQSPGLPSPAGFHPQG